MRIDGGRKGEREVEEPRTGKEAGIWIAGNEEEEVEGGREEMFSVMMMLIDEVLLTKGKTVAIEQSYTIYTALSSSAV